MTPIHTKKIENIPMLSFYTKNNYIKNLYPVNSHPKHIHKPLFLLKITFKSSNSHKKPSNTNNS